MRCVQALVPMVLDAASAAAVEGVLRTKRGVRTLFEPVVLALLAYFKAKDLSVVNLPLDPPSSAADVEDWKEEWSDYAKDAGLTATSDVNNVVRWIASADVAAGTVAGRAGKAAAVADALAKRGIAVDRPAELAISAALNVVDAGALIAQCQSVQCVWVLYLGKLPGDEDAEWYSQQREAATLHGSGLDDDEWTIDLRLCPSYAKQLKNTSVATLERALMDKTGGLWSIYKGQTINRLNSTGLEKAAVRLLQLCGKAEQISAGDRAMELAYLKSYFFSVRLGRGLPVVLCHQSALMAKMRSAADELLPTVPGQSSMAMPAMMQQAFGQAAQPSAAQFPPGASQFPPDQMAALMAMMMGSGMGGGASVGSGGGPIGGGFKALMPPPAIEEVVPCPLCGKNHALSACNHFTAKKAELKKASQAAASEAAKKRREAAAAAAAAAVAEAAD